MLREPDDWKKIPPCRGLVQSLEILGSSQLDQGLFAVCKRRPFCNLGIRPLPFSSWLKPMEHANMPHGFVRLRLDQAFDRLDGQRYLDNHGDCDENNDQ